VGFYNTINETGRELAQSRQHTDRQEDEVARIFQAHRRLSPSQAHELFNGGSTPLTSIRRAITNLALDGILVKTEAKRLGIYGKVEHVWEYQQGQMELFG
jgi:hypothetical protein